MPKFRTLTLIFPSNDNYEAYSRIAGDTRVQNFLQLEGLELRMKRRNKKIKEKTIDWKIVHRKIEHRGMTVASLLERSAEPRRQIRLNQRSTRRSAFCNFRVEITRQQEVIA